MKNINNKNKNKKNGKFIFVAALKMVSLVFIFPEFFNFFQSVIKKEGIIEDPKRKQIWIKILSFLDFKILYVVARVCKSFFFILKENQRFWKLYCNQTFKSNLLVNETNWKQFALNRMLGEWDVSRMGRTNFQIGKLNKKIVTNTKKEFHWKCCITKNHLEEGLLQPFKILNTGEENYPNLTIGVSKIETNLLSTKYFGCDEYRWGYYSDNFLTYIAHNGKGSTVDHLVHFSQIDTFYILLHQVEVIDKPEKKRCLSYFVKKNDEDEIKYQITTTNIPSSNQKLFCFVSACQKESSIGLCIPIPNGESYLPKSLEFYSF